MSDEGCDICYGLAVIPCENCGESDEHTCHIDGEEYGPYPCPNGCVE
jgi:hypothetical protein